MFDDSPNLISSYVLGLEGVIISLFSSNIETIINQIGDTNTIFLVVISFWMLWLCVNGVIDFVLNTLWDDHSDEVYIYSNFQKIIIDKYQKNRKKYKKVKNKNWHELVLKIKNAINVLLLYIVINIILKILTNSWLTFRFGAFETIAAILIFLIIMYSILQVFVITRGAYDEITQLISTIERNKKK